MLWGIIKSVAANKEATKPRVPFGKVEVITSKILRSPPWLRLGWPLWNICVTNGYGYVPLVVNTSRSFPHSRLITGGFVTRLTRRVSLVEQELPTLPDHLSSPPIFSGIRVTRSLVLYICFVDRCLSFCTFSFGHCLVCSSSIYGFWLPLWYLQTLRKWYLSYPFWIKVTFLTTPLNLCVSWRCLHGNDGCVD
jgi:hypothetical protein